MCNLSTWVPQSACMTFIRRMISTGHSAGKKVEPRLQPAITIFSAIAALAGLIIPGWLVKKLCFTLNIITKKQNCFSVTLRRKNK
jgi:hypothetical protein